MGFVFLVITKEKNTHFKILKYSQINLIKYLYKNNTFNI